MESVIVGDQNETQSKYAWVVNEEPCFVSWWDLFETGGNTQMKMVGILDSRITETGENLEDAILKQLCAATQAKTTDLGTIVSIVKASGATGGMNPTTAGQTLWRAENEDTINWSVEGVGRSRKGYNTVEDNKGKLDVLVLPDQFFNETCEIADAMVVGNQDIKTRGGTKYADLGTTVPIIMGLPVIRDPAWNSAEANTGVGLDLNGIHLVTAKRWDRYMYPFKEMAHHGRFGQASVQMCVSQLTCSSRWTQLLLSNLA